MEIRELFPFVLMLVVIGVLLGAGILVVDKFGSQTRTLTTLTSNETVTFAANTADTAFDQVYGIDYFGNSSINTVLNSTSIVVGRDINFTTDGVLTINMGSGIFYNRSYNIRYTYYKNSTTTDTMDYVSEAISGLSSTWISLIVVIVILAIILGIVVGSFQQRP